MVKVKENLTGKNFGLWTVIKKADDYVDSSGKSWSQWLCECSCQEHNRRNVIEFNLIKGFSQSCGCTRKEKMSKIGKNFKKYNEWLDDIFTDEYGSYRIGITFNTHKEFYIDLDDYEKVKDYCWYEQNNKQHYHSLMARDCTTGKQIRMHYLLGCKGYDHKDKNPFNNRRYNLRKCTYAQNTRNRTVPKNNTSGIIGVSLDKSSNKWRANIIVDGKYMYLGIFTNKEDAIKTRLQAEAKYFGAFAPQQHLFEQYGVEPMTKQSD